MPLFSSLLVASLLAFATFAPVHLLDHVAFLVRGRKKATGIFALRTNLKDSR